MTSSPHGPYTQGHTRATMATTMGCKIARLKLKGIDGGPHKQWSMWFNSMQREEHYLGLTSRDRCRDVAFSSETRRQVLHGCRQLVS